MMSFISVRQSKSKNENYYWTMCFILQIAYLAVDSLEFIIDESAVSSHECIHK